MVPEGISLQAGTLAWSPDGRRLAVGADVVKVFSCSTPPLASAKGSLIFGGYPGASRWSPDGSRLAGVGGAGDPPTTGVVDAGATRLTDPTRNTPKRFKEIKQMWSPDGRLIARGAFARRVAGMGSAAADTLGVYAG